MNLVLSRNDIDDEYTGGSLYLDGLFLGYTLEDKDRKIEEFGVEAKVKGKTAIPRGKYEVILSFSNRFQKVMPEVLNVPGFTGVRIHGGNTTEDTEGCPLLGVNLEDGNISDCASVNGILRRRLEMAERRGERCWLEVT